MSQQPLSSEQLELRRTVLLTAQTALLGEVSAAVRGVTLGWSAEEVHLRVIFDGEISEGDKESMECVGTEIVAALPEHRLEVEVVRADAPSSLDEHFLAAWVYIRKEPEAM